MCLSSFILFCFRRAGDLGEFCVQVVWVRVGVGNRVRVRVRIRARARARARVRVRVRVKVRARAIRVRARAIRVRDRFRVKLWTWCLSVFRAGSLDARSRYKFTVCPLLPNSRASCSLTHLS